MCNYPIFSAVFQHCDEMPFESSLVHCFKVLYNLVWGDYNDKAYYTIAALSPACKEKERASIKRANGTLISLNLSFFLSLVCILWLFLFFFPLSLSPTFFIFPLVLSSSLFPSFFLPIVISPLLFSPSLPLLLCLPLSLSPSTRVKLEKERREKSRQPGLMRTEGSEGGEDMERERRVFQLQMCEVGGFGASQNITATSRNDCGGRDSHRTGGLVSSETHVTTLASSLATCGWMFLTIEKVSEIHVSELYVVLRQGQRLLAKPSFPLDARIKVTIVKRQGDLLHVDIIV